MKHASALVAKWLLKAGAISAEKVDLYEYAIYSFLFSSFPLLVVICLGAIFHMVLEGVVMIAPFMLIRKFSGGFHLKSSIVCTVSSITLLSLSLVLIRLISAYNQLVLLTAFTLLISISVFFNSPIDSEERKLSTKEVIAFRKICRGMLLAFLIIYIALLFFQSGYWAIPIGMGIILTSVLQFPCLTKKILRQFRRKRSAVKEK